MCADKVHTLRIAASTDELEHIRSFVSNHARSFGFTDSAIRDITLAVDEACTNIIKHAYKWDPEQEITIQLKMHQNEMIFSVTDRGKAFDPKSYDLPTMQEQLDKKKRSGYGILLIRKLMDKVEYLKNNSHNEIRMSKKR